MTNSSEQMMTRDRSGPLIERATDRLTHIMVDCETLSLSRNAVLIQIAAVGFDPYAFPSLPCTHAEATQHMNRLYQCAFEAFPDIGDQMERGRETSVDTLRFWLGKDTRSMFFALMDRNLNYGKPYRDVLVEFRNWIISLNTSVLPSFVRFWCSGNLFDWISINDAFDSEQLTKPWDVFRSPMDTRSLRNCVYALGTDPATVRNKIRSMMLIEDLPAHNAIHDAILQVLEVQYIHAMLRRTPMFNEESHP